MAVMSAARMILTSVALILTVAPAVAQPPCAGDCNGDAHVSIDELVTGVTLMLAPGSRDCAAMDGDHNGTVIISELVSAVGAALDGCGPSPTVTSTPDPPTPTPADVCGDEAKVRQFAECIRTTTESDCISADGRWGRYPYSQRPGCFCDTGQGGCPCSAPEDCLGDCYTSFGGQNDCDQVRRGTCSGELPVGGCFCVFSSEGHADGLCIDP